MNWFFFLIASAVIAALFIVPRISSVPAETARGFLQQGALVIDVRSPEEFRSDHVPGALNIPLNELRDRLPREVPDKNRVLLLHCLSGMRSGHGRRQLQRLGYTNVLNLGSLARTKQIVNGARNR
jgi:phage shock protein E